ncbi:MAG: ShlB/FhaC/HecB family hemolysin secretion/activation protein [Stenomitos frigidus ULC029]
MRTTEQAPFSPLTQPPGMTLAVPLHPAPTPIPLSDRLKVAGLIALTGTLGIGVVLLGRALWQADIEETLLPLPGETERGAQPTPLRDRVSVLMPTPAAISPPESRLMVPSKNDRQPRSQPQVATAPAGYGFGAISQPATIVANPVPTTASAPQQTAAPAPQAATAPSPATVRSRSPLDIIAALLQPPQSTTAGNVASSPQPNAVTSSSNAGRNQQPGLAPVPQPVPGSEAAIAPVQPSDSKLATTPASEAIAPVQPGDSTATPAPAAAAIVPVPSGGNKPTATPVPASETAAIAKPPSRKDEIYVDRLQITGNTRFSQQQLAAVVQTAIAGSAASPANSDPTVIKRTLTPAELVQASEAITELYTKKGYITSGAYVPAEVLNGATPEIRVVEGKLEAINVEVLPPKFLWFGQPLSQNYVRGRLSQSIRLPLQISQLADAVKWLEQDALIDSISTTLAPGTTTGRSILNVKVQQAVPFKASVSVDNGRAPSVGRLRQQISVSQANLLGLGDRLQAGYNRSEGSNGWDVGYSLPINASNGTLSFNYSSNRGRVIEAPFQDLDIKSRSQNYDVSFRQPLKQTATEEFAVTLRGTHYRNEGVFLETFNDGVPLPFPAQGSDLNGVTSVTALRFGQEWLKRSDRDVISLQSEFSVGINAIGATILDTPPDGRFFAWQGRGFWVHSFAPDTLFALKAQVQLADRPLVPVEQISLGGIDTVRGYRTSTLLADTGWFASAEAYLPILRVPKLRGVLQVVPFLDIAQGKNRGDAQPSPNKLASVGIGLQWRMGDKFRARLDWGVPLINATSDNGRSLKENLFFSIVFTP